MVTSLRNQVIYVASWKKTDSAAEGREDHHRANECWWKAQRQAQGADAGWHPGRQADGNLEFSRDSDQRAALHGLTRALAAAAVQGVSTGFTRELDITGVGYRADVKGKIATFTLGYSHPIEVLLPEGVELKIDKQTHLVLSGYDKQMVGQVAANIRALRPPDPYKNKGVRYTGEVLRKKAGKTGAAEQERSKWRDLLRTTFEFGFTRASGAAARHRGAAAPGRVPQREAYLRAGD